MSRLGFAALAVGLVGASMAAPAWGKDPIVGGAPMSPSKTIVENAAQAKNLTTLVEAVKAAGLADTLKGPGPFTVFAPTNEAFAKLPPGTVDNLLRAENKPQLQAVLSYHVVPGLLTTKDLREQIKAGGGKAELKTVQGEILTVEEKGKVLMVSDTKGNTSKLATSDVKQSNGVVDVIDVVLLP